MKRITWLGIAKAASEQQYNVITGLRAQADAINNIRDRMVIYAQIRYICDALPDWDTQDDPVLSWVNVMLPEYCVDYNAHRLDGCQACSLSNYGRDCRNNTID